MLRHAWTIRCKIEERRSEIISLLRDLEEIEGECNHKWDSARKNNIIYQNGTREQWHRECADCGKQQHTTLSIDGTPKFSSPPF